jgi:CheY-like chemotaxis protein
MKKILRPKKQEPIPEKEERAAEKQEPTPKKQEKNMYRKTILFVDDEQFVLDGVARLLREFRKTWQVKFALNGKEALENIKEAKPDLVVVDIRMPGMNGFELLERIKEKYPSIPVLILTGDHERTLKRQALDLGAEDLLNKPIYKEDLVSRIRNILSKTESEAEVHRFKNIIAHQAEIIKQLEQENAQFSKTRYSGKEKDEIEKYRAICGSLAHSLREEFLNIGFANEEIRESENMPPGIKEECEQIDRSMAHSAILLQQLLDYFDMGTSRIEPVDALELVKEVEMLARSRLLSNINLKITIAPNIKKPIIHGNSEQLMGIVLGLINNAKNELHQKGGTIRLELEEKDKDIEISINDNGNGIPAKIRKQLFKKRVPSKNGLGLGLFLYNKVVRELGGQLILKGTSSKGTTFLLLLPKINDKKED